MDIYAKPKIVEKSQRSRLGYSVWMRVSVLYFGILKDVAGQGSATMEIADGTTTGELVAMLRGALGAVLDSAAVAVNQEYARAGDVLKDGDEVALLPPVSGGRAWR